MQTSFSPAQLADPATAEAESVIRRCVHCGFCTATCPTYVLLGDELDSPRGRIWLIRDMLENERTPTPQVVKHIDRCLSCLACKTTCPSDVDYMQLIDHARAYVEKRYRRPLPDRLVRGLLAWVLPHRRRFAVAIALGRLGRPFAGLIEKVPGLAPIAAMLRLAPAVRAKPPSDPPEPMAARRGRVALLRGCVEPSLRPEIAAATHRLIARMGFEVCAPPEQACCGALVHHMGREAQALDAARRNVDAWTREIEAGGLDAILITASGCGTTVKDYGHMLRLDPDYAEKARRVSGMARDISEWLVEAGLPPATPRGLTVAYQSACSLQHGQRVTQAPQELLRAAGFEVRTPAEPHLCCGSAGAYNILQPEIAGRLRERKLANIERLAAHVVATGNIGCAMQLGGGATPVVHTVELLDWATGGPAPAALA